MWNIAHPIYWRRKAPAASCRCHSCRQIHSSSIQASLLSIMQRYDRHLLTPRIKQRWQTGTFKNSVAPASTLLPPGMPGYQPDYTGIQFDRQKAKDLFQSVYPPNMSKVPSITFSYPSSLISCKRSPGIAANVAERSANPDWLKVDGNKCLF